MHTRKKNVLLFFLFFRERNFHASQIFTSDNYILSSGKTAIFRTQFSSHTTIESSHTTEESSHTTIESSHTTEESSHTTVESSHTTMKSSHTTVESSQSTMKSSQNTREQKYKENGRILHNLALVQSKSIKIEHGPAISIDCLDLSLK